LKVSYVIVTRNRRDTLLRTIAKLQANPDLPREQWELIVVDNASEDDTAEAVVAHHHGAHVIRLQENEGVPARNHAIPVAKGRYLVFLDDDSYPLPGSLAKALPYLATHAKTAALVARVVLPDGSFEAPAMPAVTMGGASIIRRTALQPVGGFAPEFFRQAEEYDFSFRLWKAGYKVERFEDALFGHDKVAGGRCSALVRKMDLRNNLILVERYLPRELRRAYRRDWVQRYALLGLHEGHQDAINAAICEARVWAERERTVGRKVLDRETIERLFQLDAQAKAVAEWSRTHAVRRVVIGDFSKNVYATWRACRRAGLTVVAVADGNPAYAGSRYRGMRILSDAQSLLLGADGVVLSTVNPAQVDARMSQLQATFPCPILRLWEPKYLAKLPKSGRDKAA
jgi:GT2 family glycosyltransferase